ncbi:MAG TPA: hypothetical protein VLB76_00215 [Thermoanaerobaculia bacterium]|jgi:hypothetical protein|nr:hypothetical protein [Thermoanaerobaculia bacterium]
MDAESTIRKNGGDNQYILVATNPTDSDSFLVQEALHRKGVRADLIHFTDFPSRSTASLHLDSHAGEDRWSLTGQRDLSRPPLPSAIWWRRPESPVIPSDVHPEDKKFVLQETVKFLRGLWHGLPTETVYVNSPTHAIEADRKPYQLQTARQVGFTIPPTLFSNDPAEIRAAVRKWGGRAIYKSFGSVNNFWWDPDKQKILALFTTIVEEDSLADNDTLSLTPGIYQPLLSKAFELRVTVFGSTAFGIKILSQEQKQSQTDWRNGQRTLQYEPFEVSPDLRQLCVKMLRRLGLLMGCFDFVVTPQGDVVFLEINESGQFLWVEGVSGVPLLDAFSDFLIRPRAGFRWKASPEPLRIQHVQAAASEKMAQAAEVHLFPEPLIHIDAASPSMTVPPHE